MEGDLTRVPGGQRAGLTRAVFESVVNDPESARTHWRPFLADFCEIVMDGCRKRDRTCLNIFAQGMKLVGAQIEMTVNFWQQIGIQDPAQGKALVERALKAQDLDPETAWRLSEQFVQDYRREHGLPELVEAKRKEISV